MNRFEALNILGLKDGASDDEIRLACYGIEKATAAVDFTEEEHLARRAEGLSDNARAAKKFLLSSYTKTAARKTHEAGQHGSKKVTVTPTEEKQARLHGFERLRVQVVSYLDNEYTKRRSSIWMLAVCIVVSFIALRLTRGMPRIVAFIVIGAFAIAGSSILTVSHQQIKKATPYLLEVDKRIRALKRDLGFEVPSEEEIAAASTGINPRDVLVPAIIAVAAIVVIAFIVSGCTPA